MRYSAELLPFWYDATTCMTTLQIVSPFSKNDQYMTCMTTLQIVFTFSKNDQYVILAVHFVGHEC